MLEKGNIMIFTVRTFYGASEIIWFDSSASVKSVSRRAGAGFRGIIYCSYLTVTATLPVIYLTSANVPYALKYNKI